MTDIFSLCFGPNRYFTGFGPFHLHKIELKCEYETCIKNENKTCLNKPLSFNWLHMLVLFRWHAIDDGLAHVFSHIVLL